MLLRRRVGAGCVRRRCDANGCRSVRAGFRGRAFSTDLGARFGGDVPKRGACANDGGVERV